MNKDTSVTRWIREITIPTALISYTYRATQKKFSKELARYHIGWGHFIILMILSDKEGQSQDGIAQSRGFDKTMIAKSVAKLEEMGLVRRENDPGDRRIKRLSLTKAGRALCPELKHIGFGIYSDLVKGFSDEESARMIEYLRRVAMNASDL